VDSDDHDVGFGSVNIGGGGAGGRGWNGVDVDAGAIVTWSCPLPGKAGAVGVEAEARAIVRGEPVVGETGRGLGGGSERFLLERGACGEQEEEGCSKRP
jgi:hypothetical protein